MRLPLVLIPRLASDQLAVWERFYAGPGMARHRREDGVWRRTQSPLNAELSMWAGDTDARRRMVNYRHRFDVLDRRDGPALCLVDTFVSLETCLPRDEIAEVENAVIDAAGAGGWFPCGHAAHSHRRSWRRGALRLDVTIAPRRREDHRAGRSFPPGYAACEVELRSGPAGCYEALRRRAWHVLDVGFRHPEPRGTPWLDPPVREITDRLPAQVELGCGASIEAGIPPLHYLHHVYGVADRITGQFCFGPRRDALPAKLISDPERAYGRFVEMYRCCFTASPTPFHRELRELHRRGDIVGPILTNNFDGLPRRVGLHETSLRRYDDIIPPVRFDPDARSLLVVGCHADRRRVQQRARRHGLQVIYLDPEGFDDIDGFLSYPLEAPQDGDILWRQRASAGLQQLAAARRDRRHVDAVPH